MIKAHCYTNIDDFKLAEWPEVFFEVPRVGDYVEGRLGNKRPTLRVVRVTHRIDDRRQPIIELELHR